MDGFVFAAALTMAVTYSKPAYLIALGLAETIIGDFSSVAASTIACKISMLLMLNAPTAYPSAVAIDNTFLFVTSMHFTKHYLFLCVIVSVKLKTVDVSGGLFLDSVLSLEIERTYGRSIEQFVVFHSGQA